MWELVGLCLAVLDWILSAVRWHLKTWEDSKGWGSVGSFPPVYLPLHAHGCFRVARLLPYDPKWTSSALPPPPFWLSSIQFWEGTAPRLQDGFGGVVFLLSVSLWLSFRSVAPLRFPQHLRLKTLSQVFWQLTVCLPNITKMAHWKPRSWEKPLGDLTGRFQVKKK